MEFYLAKLVPMPVVEDHPRIRAEILQILNAAGFQVETVSSRAEVLEHFNTAACSLVIARFH